MIHLIDWNQRAQAPAPPAAEEGVAGLLKSATDHNYGHMAFLRAGGE
ncbi:MAG: hypothetical protein M5R42_06610 [Rhodocyclaceae bacterium]|nr:hypothetical protein [Rhodocyclaceae bacterium]